MIHATDGLPRNGQPTRRAALKTVLGASACGVFGVGTNALAADAPWPQVRPITIIVPSGPGSYPDQLARLLSRSVTSAIGQQFVIEPRPGAAGIIGASAVANAKPDGYTLLYTAAALASSPATTAKMPYNPLTAFTPIAEIIVGPLLLIAHPTLGPKTMAEFLALAAAKPGSMSYGHFGTGSPAHVVMEAMAKDMGLRLNNIPYKSVPQSIQDLLGGNVPVAIVDPASAMPHITSGAVLALALTGSRRIAILPNTPTFGELKLRTDLQGWQALFGPAGMPADIANRLNALFIQASGEAEAVARIQSAGTLPSSPTMNAEEYAKKFQSEVSMWEKAARSIGLEKL